MAPRPVLGAVRRLPARPGGDARRRAARTGVLLGTVRLLCALAVAVAAPYTLVRKRLPPYFERIV
ncbi:hypothetical protein [Salinigranum rubrum]|uniref:hypothetical protein n=1 Tax=Salinigranum rubrum TaxID=755307 RepID=UPI002AA2AEB2|nr:hypothetical protein [Salinigranum rubrum]